MGGLPPPPEGLVKARKETLINSRRTLVRQLITLGTPIVLQNLVGASLNMVDTVMIGHLGEQVIGGVALANQINFLFNLLLFGIGSGAVVFTAQYWGKQDLPAIRRALGISLWIMVGSALVFGGVSGLFPQFVIGLFSPDPAVIEVGSRFLRIMAWSFVFQAVTNAFVNVLRSVEQVRLPLVAGVISLTLNTLLNWLLIFGQFGLPVLGYEGAAIATVVARGVETIIIIWVVYRGSGGAKVLAAGFRELINFDLIFVRQFLKITWPVVSNELGWALGFTVPALVFAHMGSQYLAATNIADTAIRLTIVVFFGTVNANAVLVGKAIGAGDKEGAVATGRFYSWASVFIGLTMAIILAIASSFIPSFFQVRPEVRDLAMVAMLLFAANLPLRVFGWHMIVGNLRAGGDVKFGLFLDLGMTWLVAVPLCLVAGLVLGAPYWLVYLCTLADDLPKFFLGIWRFRSRKWLRDLTGSGS